MPSSLRIAAALLAALALSSCAKLSGIDLRETPRRGREGAPNRIVVYSDFQCGFCRKAAAQLDRILLRHPARVEVFFKHFPISYHPQAVNAARAAEAARLQGRFWEMHDLLFESAGTLTDASYEELARRLGLDVERFQTDFASPGTAARVAADRAEGEKIGVDGTPFFVINRRPFYGSYADLERALE